MLIEEQRQIDRLLAELLDGDRDAAVTGLGQLLLDRPDLQAYYAQAITVVELLSLEFTQAEERRRPAGDLCSLRYPSTLPPGQSGEDGLVTHLSSDGAKLSPRRQAWPSRKAVGPYLAAAVCLLLAYAYWTHGSSNQTAQQRHGREWSAAQVGERAINGGFRGLYVHDHDSLRLLARLSRRPSVTNLVLPRHSLAKQAEVTLCSGTAWIHRQSQQRERGYLLALPPGCLMEGWVDTDAGGQNLLAVVEVDPTGVVTGQSLSFDNTSRYYQNNRSHRAGPVGSFSEKNTTEETRYFLFAGSFLDVGETGADQWSQSDYRIQLDSEDVMAIGFDDSGYDAMVDVIEERSPDRDFNDMRVCLRFSFSDGGADDLKTLTRFVPEPNTQAEPARAVLGTGYAFELAPGEQAFVSVNSYTELQNAFWLVQAEDGRIIWRHDGEMATKDKRQPTDRGVYFLRNLSDSPQSYELQGHRKPGMSMANSPWIACPHKLIAEEEGTFLVGFEESIQAYSVPDWDDVRVFVRRLPSD